MRAGAEEIDSNSWEFLAQSQAAQAAQARRVGARGWESCHSPATRPSKVDMAGERERSQLA